MLGGGPGRPPATSAHAAGDHGLEPRPAPSARAGPVRPAGRLRRWLDPGGRRARLRTEGEPDVLDTLSALVDASLVIPDDDASEPRFSMLETVRVYASERLSASPDRQETGRRHTAWMLALATELLRARGADYRVARDRLDRELPNLRAAVQRPSRRRGRRVGRAPGPQRRHVPALPGRWRRRHARGSTPRSRCRTAHRPPSGEGCSSLRAVLAVGPRRTRGGPRSAERGRAAPARGRDLDFDHALAVDPGDTGQPRTRAPRRSPGRGGGTGPVHGPGPGGRPGDHAPRGR